MNNLDVHQQACEIYPYFAEYFTKNENLYQTIEKGEPLVKSICCEFNIKKYVVNYFREFSDWSVVGKDKIKLLYATNKVPKEYLPQNRNDRVVYESIIIQLEQLSNQVGVELKEYCKAFKKGWYNSLIRIESYHDSIINFDLIYEMMNATFCYGVVFELYNQNKFISNVRPNKSWYQTWFGKLSLKELLTYALFWDCSRNDTCVKLHAANYKQENLAWPKLLRTSFQTDKYTIIELNSVYQLLIAGEEMDNCVKKYIKRCLIDSSFVFALKNERGQTISLFEVIMLNNKAYLRQHESHSNSDPKKKHTKVVKKFLISEKFKRDLVNSKSVISNRNLIGRSLLNLFPSYSDVRFKTSYDLRQIMSDIVKSIHPFEIKGMDLSPYIITADDQHN